MSQWFFVHMVWRSNGFLRSHKKGFCKKTLTPRGIQHSSQKNLTFRWSSWKFVSGRRRCVLVEYFDLLVELYEFVVAEGRQNVKDCRKFSADEVRRTLVISGLGLFLCRFWFALMCKGILGAVITTFLGFVGHCTVEIFRRLLVPRLY